MSETVVLERLSAVARQNPALVNSIRRQRVYILPTRQGLIFSVLLTAMLLGAINYNNSMAYLLTFLLASLMLVCMLHTYRNLAGLIISSEPARPVFAGEVAYFPMLIDNQHEGIKPALEFSTEKRRMIPWRKTGPVLIEKVHVPANRKTRCKLPVKTHVRGLLSPSAVTVSTRYPLGLFRAWSSIQNNRRCIVYPRPSGNIPLPDTFLANPRGEGGGKTGADDFVGFRHYRPGDSVRNIAWKALSREQPLLVKRFSGERGSRLVLSWHQLSGTGNTEDKLSQLSLWILQAEAAGHEYGLEIPGIFIEPAQGENHRHACLEALARFGTSDA